MVGQVSTIRLSRPAALATAILSALLLPLLPGPSPAQAGEVEFNYEGRIKIHGQPFTGTGYFKFAIVTNNGQVTLWSNDGTSISGGEPAAAVVVNVTDGVFNVVVGDSGLPNMASLDPTIFNAEDQVRLRVWFSDNPASGFEHLHPDRKITNPALLGSQSFDPIALYVNPDTGDDAFSGLSPEEPKRTIQAAWDAVPSMVRESISISLADGTYRESALLSGKMLIGGATIAIVGNATSPSAVVLSGADIASPTLPVRQRGIMVENRQDIFIQGIRFEDYMASGLYVGRGSVVEVEDCVFHRNTQGIAVDSARIMARRCLVQDGRTDIYSTSQGIWIRSLSRGLIEECNISGVVWGIHTTEGSRMELGGTIVSHCGQGLHLHAHSGAVILPDPTTFEFNTTGIRASAYSVIWGTDRLIYDGNTTNIELVTGALASAAE